LFNMQLLNLLFIIKELVLFIKLIYFKTLNERFI